MSQSQYWRPTGPERAALRSALMDAFNQPDMILLISDFFYPENFQNIAPPSFGVTYEQQLFQLIQHAQQNDWLVDLVAAAHIRRPKNPLITRIAEKLGLTATGLRLNNPIAKPLEDIIQANAQFINLEKFLEKLGVLEGQVCWIDIPGGGGTGFLVGPDLVLTNDHVIERIRSGQARWQDVKCRFDYKQALNGISLDRKKPTEVALDSSKPLIDSSPPSQYDWNSTLGNAGPEEADFALLRLAEKIGDLPVGGGTADTKAQPRSWINVKKSTASLTSGRQVFLLQHPKGEPLQLSIGTVRGFNTSGTRLRYDANSKDGSSGSPCFNADLELIALHHARDPAYPPQWNQAIPIDLVLNVWRDHNITVP